MNIVAPAWTQDMFQILFVSMGQGDCCIVTCPDGKHIMIDCGSKALEAPDAMVDVQDLIRSNDVLNLPNSQQLRVYALVLTHPDKDHISKVAEILGGEKYVIGTQTHNYGAIPVNKLYFSDFNTARNDFQSSPLRLYGLGQCASTLYDDVGLTEMYCVTLRTGTQTLDKWVPPFNATKHSDASATIANDRVTIANGTATSGATWEVSIVAGNVAREFGDQSDTDGRNAASLVTLVRLGTDKALICGDATLSTENYLYSKFKKATTISTVGLLQAPHHGSSVTSSTANFAGLVKPQQLAISVQFEEHSHHLPGSDAINSYVANIAQVAQHPVTAWVKYLDQNFTNLKNQWIADKGNAKMTYREELDDQWRVTRYVRTNYAGTFDGPVVLDGFNSQSKYVLYQTPLDKDINQTGHDGHLWYYFP